MTSKKDLTELAIVYVPFASLFDPLEILNHVSGPWSVSLLSEFPLRAFGAAVTEWN